MRRADVTCRIIVFLLLFGRIAVGFQLQQERTTIMSPRRGNFRKHRQQQHTRNRPNSWTSFLEYNDASSFRQGKNVISVSASVLEDSESSSSLVDEEFFSQGYLDRFGGVGRLYSSGSSNAQVSSETVMDRLRQATVVIVGIGGVGSWAAEAICRSGVGNIVLIDLDDICISNTNRQIHATTSKIGQMKIDVMKQRLLDIHHECNVTLVHDFVDETNAREILEAIGPITALIDAIDGALAKSALIGACTDLAIPVVTVGGAAGRRDPFQIMCADLVNVEDDRLLANCRKTLRKKYNFPAGLSFSQQRVTKKKVKKWRIACVYTREAPPTKRPPVWKTGHDDDDDDVAPSSSFRLCDGSLGTACFVTGAYGFAAASICIDMIANNKLVPPRRG
eukprot:scaffold2576_cov175-Amphora_coffeaeformis.AAC.6